MTARRPLRLLHVLAETGYSGGEVQLKVLLEHFARLGWENHGLLAPGAKFAPAARELGVRYKTMQETLADAIAWYRAQGLVT